MHNTHDVIQAVVTRTVTRTKNGLMV